VLSVGLHQFPVFGVVEVLVAQVLHKLLVEFVVSLLLFSHQFEKLLLLPFLGLLLNLVRPQHRDVLLFLGVHVCVLVGKHDELLAGFFEPTLPALMSGTGCNTFGRFDGLGSTIPEIRSAGVPWFIDMSFEGIDFSGQRPTRFLDKNKLNKWRVTALES